mmetsp:Transcript_26434/g.39088  ORF Transcript_26434/g.39088 Transcript_26434/m.39088 type:complete len:295 (-) Transcript_26434:104-988(-)
MSRENSSSQNNNDGNVMLFDMDAVTNNSGNDDIGRDPPPRAAYTPSVDTTFLASSVGSVVGPEKSGFLRSLCLSVDDDNNMLRWDVTFADPITATAKKEKGSSSKSKVPKFFQKAALGLQKMGIQTNIKAVTIASIEGHAASSHIRVGDVVTRINGKKIGPSYNAQRCSDLINTSYADKNNNYGIVSIQTGNEDGIDTVLQATILKPHPKATCKDLGLEVWWWRGLCVRSIEPESLFAQSGLKVDDELESINQISLTYNDNVNAKDFDHIVKHLPCEVTLVVKRSKHRATGAFK